MTPSPAPPTSAKRRLSAGQRLVRVLFVALDAPVLFAVAIGLLAAWLSPQALWWPQLVATGLPYAAWALAGLTLGAVAFRWRGLVLVHLGLLVLVGLRTAPLDRLSSGDAQEGDLKLITFNLPQTGPSRDALADSAVAFVEAMAPDLLLLQDTWVDAVGPAAETDVHVEAIDDRLPYSLAIPASPTPIADRDPGSVGVPVLVRDGADIEVLEVEQIVPEGDANVSLALRTHLQWHGRDLVLYNVHLRSFGSRKPWEDASVDWRRPATWTGYLRQYRRAYRLRAAETEHVARRVEAETLPVIVAGDFNSTPDNWTAHRLQRAGAARRDAFEEGAGLRWGRTYHALEPLVRIDLVLVDPALQVSDARVRNVGFSDHRPVLTRLRWRAEGE